jgi:Zn-dependent protease
LLLLRLGSIPVRIRVPFFFLALLLGASYGYERRPDLMGLWVVVVFVSVLVHELGHALMGRIFGLAPQIELHGMGGTTSWIEARDVGHARSIAISVAGPFAGFSIAALLYLANRLGFHPENAHLQFALERALAVNFVWGIFNLAPMLPLDGGNVMRSTLHLVTKGRGEKPARVISILIGGLLLAWALMHRAYWLGALGAFFTWANVQGYRQADAPVRNDSADAPLAEAVEKAYVALERHDGAEAIALLRPVIVPQASEELRAIALRVYSYALLLEGKWDELLPTLEKNAPLIGDEEMTRYAKTARELGRAEEAQKIAALIRTPRAANDFSS